MKHPLHARRLTAAGLAAAAALAAAPAAGAAPAPSPSTLLTTTVTARDAVPRECARRALTSARGVASTRVVVPASGVLALQLTGASGDWDVAAFDAVTGGLVAGAAGFGADEVASGFVGGGRAVTIQACRRSGTARSAKLTVTSAPVPTGTVADKPSLVRVHLRQRDDVHLLEDAGFDLTEHGAEDFVEVVAYGEDDLDRIRDLGLRLTVRVDDLVAEQSRALTMTRKLRAAGDAPAMPSGRTDYRRLVDYESDMKKLVEQHPGLVRPVTLPHKTLEGRTVTGIEIARDVNAQDGRPVFMQMGVHHAREWPSGEHAIEWAYELLNGVGKDKQVDDLIDRVRTVIVPVVNPDGFNVSREAPIDLVNDPEYQQLPAISQTAAYLVDPALNYKRRNCRLHPGQASSPPGLCGTPAFRLSGVDPNRNYGGLWGGPGASALPVYDTYRGEGPFSEPETRNVRAFVSQRQVTTLITNHTFSNLVLRPPGVKSQGLAVDEPGLKALGDAMAAENGYLSQPSWALYDTTGTTEDWTYTATGGYGYTFEIGPDVAIAEGGGFHPPFPFTVKQYREGSNKSGGNRAAYFKAMSHAADTSKHSLLVGRAPEGVTLRVKKEFVTETSPVEPAQTDVLDGAPSPAGPRQTFPDVLDTTMVVGRSGRFEWSVNPSTRPIVDMKTFPGVAETSTRTDEVASKGRTTPNQVAGEGEEGTYEDHAFTITEADQAEVARITLTPQGTDDYDITVFRKDGETLTEVGSSGNIPSESEEVLLDKPPVGDYVLRVTNYLAFGPYTGKIERLAKGEDTIQPRSTTEAWTLTCEAGGKVLASQKVVIERGERKTISDPCGANATQVVQSANGSSSSRVCASTAGFRTVSARGLKGGRVRFGFSRRVAEPVTVELFRVSQGRRVLGERRVARLTGLSRSVTWSGRDARGRRLGDGYYFARFRVKGPKRTDVRRVVLVRRGGRFSVRPTHHRPDSCGLLQSAKLERPVFGGRTNRPLRIAFRVARSSRVVVDVLRGGKVLRRYKATRVYAPRRTHRLRVRSERIGRGDVRVRITARAGSRSGSVTLLSRRL